MKTKRKINYGILHQNYRLRNRWWRTIENFPKQKTGSSLIKTKPFRQYFQSESKTIQESSVALITNTPKKSKLKQRPVPGFVDDISFHPRTIHEKIEKLQ